MNPVSAAVALSRWVREVVVVLGVLVLVEVSLRREPLADTCRRVGVRLALDEDRRAVAGGVLPRSSRRAHRVVTVLLHRWPLGDTCLRRCLVLGQRVQHLDPVLRIGARTEGASFSVHSWLEVGGMSLDPTAPSYGPLAGSTGA